MPTKGLKAWTQRLSKREMPVIGEVIEELNKITSSDETGVNQLAEVILRDPQLTSQVLRVANSVQYNYSRAQVNTISRAIVLIGLKGVRAICISLLVMDSLLGEHPKEQLLKIVARAFHAATQARNLATEMGEKNSEEVFIAGLLFHLGEMAFWATEEADRDLPGLYSEDAVERREAMDEVLGTSFKAITRELARHWKLGSTLEEALNPSSSTASTKVQAVIIGERLSRAALYGWASPQIKRVLSEIMVFTGKNAEYALKMVREGADQAASTALSYGVSEVCPLIPSSSKKVKVQPRKIISKMLKGDPMVQLSILRDLSVAATDNLDVNTIFQMVIEGMHRGIGLERVCIAFVDRHKLKAKYMLGEGTDHWRSSFMIDIGPYSENLFTDALTRNEASWFTAEMIKQSPQLYDDNITRIVGKMPSFVSALTLGQRKVGLFYADRWTHGGLLEEEQFESFKHFAMQAQTILIQQSAARKANDSSSAR